MNLNGRQLLAWLLVLLLATHLVLLGFFQISSLDTWFHLKEGELYVTTGSLPAQDPFAFTTEGRVWIKYSWLADVLFYLVYAAGGIPGLILLRLAILFAIAGLLYFLLRGCGVHPVAAVLLVFVASLALRFRLFVRPELITFLFVLATMALLLRLRAAPPWTAYTLLPLFVAWVNVHGSYVFGFGLPALVLLANLLPGDRAVPGWGHLRLDTRRCRHLAIVVGLLPLAGLLNPQGYRLLLFPFWQNRMVRLTMFPEWMAAWRYPAIDPVWWEPIIVLALVLLVFCIVAALLWVWENRFDPVGWGIVLSIGAYAVLRNRAIPYFVLAVLPPLALSLLRIVQRLPVPVPTPTLRRIERVGVAACLILLVLAIVDQAWLTRRFAPGFGVAPHFPEKAAVFLERHRLDGRIFNSYTFGGYLMWRRWPANQLFIDGRYDAILFDEELLEQYLQAHQSPDALERIATAYGIEVLVLDADPKSRIRHLAGNSAWARVYWDPVAEIFLRRGGKHAGLISEREYRFTGSRTDLGYLVAYRKDASTWRQAMVELQRATDDNPENEIAWQALAQEYAAVGGDALALRLEALARASMLLKDSPAATRLRADRSEVLLQLGRVQEAAAAAREALRMDRDLLLPRWVLAAVAERQGAWEEARNHLRDLLSRMDADHPMAARVRDRLEYVERSVRGEGVR